jgi:hypothetical protein
MRDLALDQARAQRLRLDSALLQRRLKDTLAALGEVVYELAARGELGELEEVPEIADCLIELEELEMRIVEMGERTREPEPPVSAGRGRARWSKSRRSSGVTRGGGEEREEREPMRVWRPNVDDLDDDDGTVSAFGAGADEDPLDDAEPASSRGRDRARERSRDRSRGRSRRRGGARGGIAFVDDDPLDPEEDLSRYMHEDDVADPDESSGAGENS